MVHNLCTQSMSKESEGMTKVIGSLFEGATDFSPVVSIKPDGPAAPVVPLAA